MTEITLKSITQRGEVFNFRALRLSLIWMSAIYLVLNLYWICIQLIFEYIYIYSDELQPTLDKMLLEYYDF